MSHLLSASENEASQRKSDFIYIECTEVIFSPNPNNTMNQILPNLQLQTCAISHRQPWRHDVCLRFSERSLKRKIYVQICLLVFNILSFRLLL